ncbi:MAG: hypothetical protein AUH30_05030 [Candidatus Rokubacteria bacterium 13_1_40CM_68_15]|nr:MAG: hypothetical protein AUH30_05030 [Candidatus Rokubacteria bacterium 13_1_40CM_68_15]
MKILACVVGAVLIVLMPLAHGSPIDPSSPGFWDNGDFDDVILFLTSDLHLLATDDRPPIRAFEAVSDPVAERPAAAVTQRAYEPGTPRAPPAR